MFYSANSFEKVLRLLGTERFCVKDSEKHFSGENASKGIEEKKKEHLLMWRLEAARAGRRNYDQIIGSLKRDKMR